MNLNRVKYLAAGVCILMVSGCANPKADSEPVPEVIVSNDFLDLSNNKITSQGKLDFDSLVFDEDAFTKESKYKVPESENTKVRINDILFEFMLLKSDGDEDYSPVMVISYGGEDWLFMENAMLKVNDDVITLTPSQDPYRDTLDNGGIFEYLVYDIDKESVNFLGSSKSNADLDIRIETELYEETKLTTVEYRAMKKILSAYRYYLNTK